MKNKNIGWECPVCKKGNAPGQKKCLHCEDKKDLEKVLEGILEEIKKLKPTSTPYLYPYYSLWDDDINPDTYTLRVTNNTSTLNAPQN